VSLTYVYCLVRSARRPVLRKPPSPLPGAESIRFVDVGHQLWAIVSSVPADDYSEVSLRRGLQDLEWVGRRAMAHEAVVERFLFAPALLPMQLFTLFTSDERLNEYVQRERRRIERILSRIEKHLEWGVRLTFDEKAAREAVERAHSQTTKAQKKRKTGAARTVMVRGSDYLTRKRDLLNVNRAQLAQARTEANRLYRALAQGATEARRRSDTEQAAPGSRLLLDAAFLVPARQSTAFKSALQKKVRTLDGTGLVVSLTGPWPAYNFIGSHKARVERQKEV
jgi:hypothetical protein